MSLLPLRHHARRAYPEREYLDPRAVRHLQHGYVRARLILGDHWILARRVGRKLYEHRDGLVLATASAGAAAVMVMDAVRTAS